MVNEQKELKTFCEEEIIKLKSLYKSFVVYCSFKDNK